MDKVISFLGIFIILFLASLFGWKHRAKYNWKTIGWGMLLQFIIAVLVLGIPAMGFQGPLKPIFNWANDVVIALLNFTNRGSEFVFGPLMSSDKMGGFIFAVQVLPTIIFISSLTAILYHLGVLQKVVSGIAWIMQKTMQTSGAESLSTAANIFVGQTEAPILVKPYIATMTRSELFAVMVGGMATVAGGVLAAYVGLLKDRVPDIAGHLITMSVLAGPATLVISKLMMPETKKSETLGVKVDSGEKIDSNVIEAAARGAAEGLSLALNVAGMLIAFIALIYLANGMLAWLGDLIHFQSWAQNIVPNYFVQKNETQLSLQIIFSWIFAPMAWIMGIPWSECGVAGAILGEKVALNEFVAYLHLSSISSQLSDRTVLILSYALCGFANFSSIAIQIGGIGGMAPSRKSDIANMGLLCIIGGSLTSFMTACFVGLLGGI